ncbi:MAG: class I SAM-dependent methyltransferase [Propionibacteriaceae bacterium]
MAADHEQTNWWDQAPADWAENERLCLPLYAATLDAAGLAPGSRLLDLGCGAGTALRLAADRGLRVAGLDAAAALVELARALVPEADVRTGDLGALPFADHSVEGVTLVNALQYAADPVATLTEAARVVVSGGVVVVVTWGKPDRCESRFAMAAVRRLGPSPAPGPPSGGGPFGLGAPGRLAEVFAAADLVVRSDGEIGCGFRYPDLESALRTQLASGPARRTVASVGEPAVRAALAEAMQLTREADGSFRQHNVFRCVVGRT